MMRGFSGDLADRIAIRERIEAYNDAVFRKDAEDWAECWAQDAQWQVGDHAASGREAIRDLWVRLMAGFDAAAMYVNHGALAIEGDHADSRCYMLEMLKGGDGSERLVSGQYDDTLRRDTDGIWRFTARRYTVLQVR
ncbi:nuclear transport factor 2 family protein [Novosphingobium olei]|uniref:nuclear transport factor 2 family protein n=1 Tax=Novosphingobium olei TaxID=2728851 RepID=UPI0030D31A29